MKVFDTPSFIGESQSIHDHLYDYKNTIYTNAKTKVTIKCNNCGNDFFQLPYNHLSGKGCPECGKLKSIKCRSLTTSEFNEKSIKIHGDIFDCSEVNYINNYTPVKLRCKICNYTFMRNPNSHMRGTGCPNCSGKVKLTIYTFIEKANIIHDFKYEYFESIICNNKSKVKIRCKTCEHIFYQSVASHLRGKGCPKCKTQNTISRCKLPTQEFINRSNVIHDFKYEYTYIEYVNYYVNVSIKCKECNKIFFQSPSNHLQGKGCPYCSHFISVPENEFLEYIGIPNNQNCRNRKIENFKVDGYDPITNTIYEFLGDYWHGNPEIYDAAIIHPKIKISYGELYTKSIKKFDKLKSIGYNIKYIWENDWKRFRKNGGKLNIITY